MESVNSAVCRRKFFRKSGIILVIAACFLMASCTTKAVKRQQAADDKIGTGDYIAMVNDIKKNTKLYGETNAFLFNMDIGVLFHYAGMYDSSNVYLARAYNIYDELFTRSVTNETVALLTNDNVRPYRAKPYELIMVHQIAALNFMAKGNFESALVETRKAQIHFNEWERTQAPSGKYHTDGMFHLFSSAAYEKTGEIDNSSISLFKSVDAYKKGPVKLPVEVEGFAYARLTADNRGGDVQKLKLRPNTGANAWDAKFGDAEIIVVAHAGRGPSMRENNWRGVWTAGIIVIDNEKKGSERLTFKIPAPMPPNHKATNGMVIKISLPDLVNHPVRTSYFTAQVGNAEARSVVVNDIGLQAKKALDDAWGDIIARTAVRTIIRTIANQELKKRTEVKDNPLLNFAKNVATDVATDQMEKADIRMCFYLPQSVQVIRIPVEPGTHNVTLKVHNSSGAVIGQKAFDNVEVKAKEKKVLMHTTLR